MDLALGAQQAIHIAPIAIPANARNISMSHDIEGMYQQLKIGGTPWRSRAGDKLQQQCNYKACHRDGKSHSGMCLSYGLPGTGKFSSTSKKQSLICLSST